jgi:rod shape-determining protein MreC
MAESEERIFGLSISLLLFIVLETLCILLVVLTNTNQRLIFDNTWNVYMNRVNQRVDRVQNYLGLETIIDSLVEENARLTQQLSNIEYAQMNLDQDSIPIDYKLIAAKVISKEKGNVRNSFVLNRGLRHGVQKDFGVLSSHGVLGVVTSVNQEFCKVMTAMHTDFRLNVKILNSNEFGTLVWKPWTNNTYLMEGIGKYNPVTVGDTIITSGFSLIYPPNVPVGQIVNYKSNIDEGNITAEVELFQEIQDVNYAYILEQKISFSLDSLMINE